MVFFPKIGVFLRFSEKGGGDHPPSSHFCAPGTMKSIVVTHGRKGIYTFAHMVSIKM